jgi:transcriptional regulator with PAS, ATPase and Fis domain
MLEIFDILPTIAESDSTVLIEGQSGTGKELVARAIHDLSRRREAPIVTINCGALPDSLLEAELFGYKAGAFTDARRDKPGRFALADGGTIFLDEIGDVSPALQTRLLRVLQEQTYEPLGATESEQTDVRVIAASNRSLAEMVEKGSFRQDLFYRINIVRLNLPSLNERREDIPLLVDHFIEHFNAVKTRQITDISPAALSVLMNHDYPGNVRELMNIIEHAFAICRRTIIGVRELPDYLQPADKTSEIESPSLGELESRFIRAALERNQWNRSRTATELGIHTTTLWRKMKRLGISRKSQ